MRKKITEEIISKLKSEMDWLDACSIKYKWPQNLLIKYSHKLNWRLVASTQNLSIKFIENFLPRDYFKVLRIWKKKYTEEFIEKYRDYLDLSCLIYRNVSFSFYKKFNFNTLVIPIFKNSTPSFPVSCLDDEYFRENVSRYWSAVLEFSSFIEVNDEFIEKYIFSKSSYENYEDEIEQCFSVIEKNEKVSEEILQKYIDRINVFNSILFRKISKDFFIRNFNRIIRKKNNIAKILKRRASFLKTPNSNIFPKMNMYTKKPILYCVKNNIYNLSGYYKIML